MLRTVMMIFPPNKVLNQTTRAKACRAVTFAQ